MSAATVPGPVRRLLVSHALASIGMSLPWPLLLLLVWDRLGERSQGDLVLGLTGAARMLPYVLLSWATGRLADRFRRDRLLRVTLVTRIVLLVAVSVAVAQGRLVVAVAAAALAVACGTPAYPALAAAMPDVAGRGRRRATDLLVTIEVSSFVVGPALGGLLLVPATRAWLPGLSVALLVLATVLVTGVVLPRPSRTTSTGTSAPEGTIAVLRASAAATRAIGVVGALNAVDAVLALALLPVAERVWHGGGSGYGFATGMLGFGALAAPLMWRLGSSNVTRARWGLWVLAAALVLVPLVPVVGWAVAPLVVAGAATVHIEGAMTQEIQDAVPDRLRAGVLGLTDSVMVGAALSGSLLAPWLASTLGPQHLLLLLAVVCVATGVRAPRHRPAGPRIPAQRTGGRPATAPSSGQASRADS